GGGGVDGAIHRAAGPGLLEECRGLNGCSTGEAKITQGYNLPARYVIHTVGPVYKDGLHGGPELLAMCYRNSLRLALQYGIKSIAFPSISTGAYGYPVKKAARIAIYEILVFLKEHPGSMTVTICCFSRRDLECYTEVRDSLEKYLK
ncbi:MAG: macro domain-containing protein, partial [Bacteroides sp.]|nr:macro domain-containing protein [Bacteroides sp.]